jgi:hypothetical protein
MIPSMKAQRSLVSLLGVALLLGGLSGGSSAARVPSCGPGKAVTIRGRIGPGRENDYLLLPFKVRPKTTRVEVGYRWEGRGVGDTVLDLGLWDEDGYRAVKGFRGWSGDRHGNLERGDLPIFVQANRATRNYSPGIVKPGRWHVELGVGAISSEGATYRVQVRCRAAKAGRPPKPDPVDPDHLANPEPGWYHGDFHAHAFHSNPEGPTQAEWVEYARAAGLDFLPITEYVINRHHKEWGATARANPDLLFWPGREVITYFGHAVVIGETPSVIDYRHGFEDVTLLKIQRRSVADGALFSVAHPTFFPPPIDDQCRGCFFELEDAINWNKVDTIEVLTGPMRVEETGVNPFVATAIDLWERKLEEGYKVTGVSGSDDKLGPGLGTNATAVFASELSRPAIKRAIRAGHAYVRTLGVDESPELEMIGTTADGQEAMFGDTLRGDVATIEVTVRGAAGQSLRISKDGGLVESVPITSSDFTYSFEAVRETESGPLGTFWRADTHNGLFETTIGNPIFLRAME